MLINSTRLFRRERAMAKERKKKRRRGCSYGTLGSFNSRVASDRHSRDVRNRHHLGRFISEDAAVVVVKYFACPAGKGGAEINANAFHGCIRAHVATASLYLASATRASGKDSREFFRRVNSGDSGRRRSKCPLYVFSAAREYSERSRRRRRCDTSLRRNERSSNATTSRTLPIQHRICSNIVATCNVAATFVQPCAVEVYSGH